MRFSPGAVTAIRLSAAATLLLVGCNTSANDLAKIAGCSGDYSGPFTGSIVGTATATVSSNGALHFEFSPSDPDKIGGVTRFTYELEGVTQQGFSVSGTNDTTDFTIDGSFDFDKCSLSGNWTLKDKGGAYDVSGSYVISKQ